MLEGVAGLEQGPRTDGGGGEFDFQVATHLIGNGVIAMADDFNFESAGAGRN